MSINISEVIWTVVCFFVLFIVLKKLLFDPMLRFLDQRQTRLDEAAEKNRQAQERLASAQQTAEESLQRRAQENSALEKQHRAENERTRIKAQRQARQDAARLLEDVRAKVAREEAEASDAADASLDELALLVADRLAAGTGEKGQV